MKTVTLKLSRIKEVGERLKHPAFYDEYIALGTVQGDSLIVDKQHQLAMRKKYRRHGVGKFITALASPVATGVDAIAGTNLKNCSGCDKRETAMDQVGDAIVDALKYGRP